MKQILFISIATALILFSCCDEDEAPVPKDDSTVVESQGISTDQVPEK